jgi:23S rRNA pseudouridine2605 synthase
VRYGTVELPRGLKRGNCEELAPEQIKILRDASGAGAPEPTLTLQPVIHQRRAAPIQGTVVRPNTRNSPQAWTGVYHSEARELTAFDRIREDAPSRPGRGGRKRPGGAAGGREVNGNVLRPDKPKRPGGKKPRRGAAPGQEVFIPRTWSAGDEFNRAGNAGRGRARPEGGAGGNRAGGNRDDNRGNRAPAGNRAGPANAGNRGNRSDARGNAWSSAAPGGNRKPGPGGGNRRRKPGGGGGSGGPRRGGGGGGGNFGNS